MCRLRVFLSEVIFLVLGYNFIVLASALLNSSAVPCSQTGQVCFAN